MSRADKLNSALNLLFLLAYTYFKVLELVVSSSKWFCALDLELNESYLWTIDNLRYLLANHPELRDFPVEFEPAFRDLYPATIVDVGWQEMVAPQVESFLSNVQRYVREKGIHTPEKESPAWAFVEMFRPAADMAVERAATYDSRMKAHTKRVFGSAANGLHMEDGEGNTGMKPAFISYSWDDDAHCEWVRGLAARLRRDGVNVTIDRWVAVPGDQLPAFMEKAIRENHFVVIICTPRYKQRSDERLGGVGYEGDIMTAEVMTRQNQRKFIPVLRRGSWAEAAPTWLFGKYHIDLRGDPYSELYYEDLVRTLLEIRESAPPLGEPMSTISGRNAKSERAVDENASQQFQPIKITRVIVEDVTEPLDDGTAGCALYEIPFALSTEPPERWKELFEENWDHPPRHTGMHRPGIARISGAVVFLDGTTIEEVERYHRDTLQLAISETNRQYEAELRDIKDRVQRDGQSSAVHRKRVEDVSKRIKFD